MLVILLVINLVSMRITITSRLIKVKLRKNVDYRMPKKGFEPMLYRYEWYVLTD